MSQRILSRVVVLLSAGLCLLTQMKLQAQEVAAIDLIHVEARTELRRPPPLAGTSAGYGGAHDIYECSDSDKATGALLTTLTELDRQHYTAGDDAFIQIVVQNIGRSPVQIPVSPHLADFQPADPGQGFAVIELTSVLLIGGKQWQSTSGIGHKLYGSDDRPGTILTLQPGESVRIIDRAKIDVIGSNADVDRIRQRDPIDHLNAKVSTARAEIMLGPAAIASVSREVCLSSRQGPDVPVTVSEAQQ